MELPKPAFKAEPGLSLPASLELIRPCGSKLSLQAHGARVGAFLQVVEDLLGL